jgi:hypothetical protein
MWLNEGLRESSVGVEAAQGRVPRSASQIPGQRRGLPPPSEERFAPAVALLPVKQAVPGRCCADSKRCCAWARACSNVPARGPWRPMARRLLLALAGRDRKRTRAGGDGVDGTRALPPRIGANSFRSRA